MRTVNDFVCFFVCGCVGKMQPKGHIDFFLRGGGYKQNEGVSDLSTVQRSA